MIVDDEPQVCALLEAYLKTQGMGSVVSYSPSYALNKLKSSSAISLILLDIIMPEMSGLELLKEIRKLKPDLPVIMITGQEDINVARECLEAGAKDYITKPIDLDYLETTVFVELLLSL